MKKWFVCAVLSVFSLNSYAYWDLNDVSYLMPLPEVLERSDLMGMTAQGQKGELLPAHLHQQIPTLSVFMERAEESQVLAVIAVRIDPCFERKVPLSCQKQIRMVWQPVVKNNFRGTTTLDAALHSFYVLTDDEFDSLLRDLKQWKNKFSIQTRGLPLQIHPAFSQDAKAQREFNEIILKFAGDQNLTQITAMVLRGAGNMWAFAEFHRVEEDLQIQYVPRLDRMSQSYGNQVSIMDGYFSRGGMAPAPGVEHQDNINYTVADTEFFTENADEETIRNEYRSAYAILNPKIYSPARMDCVSCHVAQNAITWLRNFRPQWGSDPDLHIDEYYAPQYDLSNLSPRQNNFLNIRGLGYYNDEPAINQRVINESAEVADTLNRLFAL